MFTTSERQILNEQIRSKLISAINKILILSSVFISQAAFAKAYPEFGSGCEVGNSKITEMRDQILNCFKGHGDDGDHCDYYNLAKPCGLKELPKISDVFLVAMTCQHITPVSTVDAFYQIFGTTCRDNPAKGKAYLKQVRNVNITWDSKAWEAWKKTNSTDGQLRPLIINRKGDTLFLTEGTMSTPENQLREWTEKNL